MSRHMLYNINPLRNGRALLAMAMLLSVLDLSVLAAFPEDGVLFKLKDRRSGQCLLNGNILASCSDADADLFFAIGVPDNYNLIRIQSGQCLDRQSCHSSTSNLRISDCSNCGAKHWDYRSDGSVREDEGKNCIIVKDGKASVQHCSDGFSAFDLFTPSGNKFLFRSIVHGDCLHANTTKGTFIPCSQASAFSLIPDIPGYYRFQQASPAGCLDREHCHLDTSNLRVVENCDHCGAIHWNFVAGKLGEDGMQNCVQRVGGNLADVGHCSNGQYELLQIVPYPATAPAAGGLGAARGDEL